MKRTSDQSALFHCFIRQIVKHLRDAGYKQASENTIKQLVGITLGNTTYLFGTKVYMSTTKYKRADEDLTEAEMKAGIISMDGFITKIVAWAAADLSLELVSPNENKT